MPVGCRRLQNGFCVICDVQENTVKIITRFLSRNRKARLVDDLDQRACRNFERCGQFAFGNSREIVARQCCKREAGTAGVDSHAAIGSMQLHLRAIGQFARDFKQGVRGHGCRAWRFDVGCKGLDNLQIKVCCGHLDLAAFAGFDQNVGQYGYSVAPLHNRLDVAQAFQQRRAFDRGSHSNSPCRAGWSANQPKNPITMLNLT